MASTVKFDSERRAMRRERHEARVARTRERQQARQLKHGQQIDAARAPRVVIEPPAPAPVIEVGAAAPLTPVEPDVAALPAPPPVTDAPNAEESKSFVPQRERDVAAFLARREEVVCAAQVEAQQRIERMGEERAVADALGALAHSAAAPWRRHRERLDEAIGTGRIAAVGACARRACRGTASDAARTSWRAPDPQFALAVTVAYAVIGQAPWVAVRGGRAERSCPAPSQGRTPRAFWR